MPKSSKFVALLAIAAQLLNPFPALVSMELALEEHASKKCVSARDVNEAIRRRNKSVREIEKLKFEAKMFGFDWGEDDSDEDTEEHSYIQPSLWEALTQSTVEGSLEGGSRAAGRTLVTDTLPKMGKATWDMGKGVHKAWKRTQSRSKNRLTFCVERDAEGSLRFLQQQKTSAQGPLEDLLKTRIKAGMKKEDLPTDVQKFISRMTSKNILFDYEEDGKKVIFKVNRETGKVKLHRLDAKEKFVHFQASGGVTHGKKQKKSLSSSQSFKTLPLERFENQLFPTPVPSIPAPVAPSSPLLDSQDSYDCLEIETHGDFEFGQDGDYRNMDVTAGQDILNKYHQKSQTDIDLRAGRDIVNQGLFHTPQGTTRLTAGRDVDVTQGVTVGQKVQFKAGRDIRTGGRTHEARTRESYKGERGSVTYDFWNPDPEGKGSVLAKDDLSLEAGGQIHNDLGHLRSEGSATYKASSVVNRGGKLWAGGDMTIETPHFENTVFEKTEIRDGKVVGVLEEKRGGTHDDAFHLRNLPVPEVTSLGSLKFVEVDDFTSQGHIHGKKEISFLRRNDQGELVYGPPPKRFVLQGVDEVEHRSRPGQENNRIVLDKVIPTLTSDHRIIRGDGDLVTHHNLLTTEEGFQALLEKHQKLEAERKEKGVAETPVPPLEKLPYEAAQYIYAGVMAAPLIVDAAGQRLVGVTEDHRWQITDALPQTHLDLLETIQTRELAGLMKPSEGDVLFQRKFLESEKESQALPSLFVQGMEPEKAASLKQLFSSQVIEENILAATLKADRVSRMGGCDGESNLQSLMENTQAFYTGLGLSSSGPQVLTEELLKKAERPILYFVEGAYKGQKGLVPKVYRPLETINPKGLRNSGAVLSNRKVEAYDKDALNTGLDSTIQRLPLVRERRNHQRTFQELSRQVQKDKWGRRKETTHQKVTADPTQGGLEQSYALGQVDQNDRQGNRDYTGPGAGLTPSLVKDPCYTLIQGAGSDTYTPVVESEKTTTRKKGVWGGAFHKSTATHSSTQPVVQRDRNVGEEVKLYNEGISRASLDQKTQGRGVWSGREIRLDGKKQTQEEVWKKYKLRLSSSQGEAIQAAAQGKSPGTVAEKVLKQDGLAQAINQHQESASSLQKDQAGFNLINEGWNAAVDAATLLKDPTQIGDMVQERLGLKAPSLGFNHSKTQGQSSFSHDVPSSIQFTEGWDIVADTLALKDGSQGRAKNINLYIKDRVILSGGKTIYASQLKEKSGGLDLNSAGQISARGHQAAQSQESVQNFNAALIADETLTTHGKMKELVLEGGTIGGLKKTSLKMEKLTTRAPTDTSKQTSHSTSASGSTAGGGSASYQESLQESQLLNSPNYILGEEVEATADVAETQGLVIEGTKKRVLNLGDWTDRPVAEFEKEKNKAVSGGYAPTALLPVTGYGGETHHATHQTWHTTLLPSEEANEGPLPDSVVTDASQTRQVTQEKKSSHRFGFVIPNLEKIREDGAQIQEVFSALKEEASSEDQLYYQILEEKAEEMEEAGVSGDQQQQLLEKYAPEILKALAEAQEEEETKKLLSGGTEENKKGAPYSLASEGEEDLLFSQGAEEDAFSLGSLYPSLSSSLPSCLFKEEKEENGELLSLLGQEGRNKPKEAGLSSYFSSYEDFRSVQPPVELSSEEKLVHHFVEGVGEVAGILHNLSEDMSKSIKIACQTNDFTQKACQALNIGGEATDKTAPEGDRSFWDDLQEGVERKKEEISKDLHQRYPSIPQEKFRQTLEDTGEILGAATKAATFVLPAGKAGKALKVIQQAWQRDIRAQVEEIRNAPPKLLPQPRVLEGPAPKGVSQPVPVPALTEKVQQVRERILANPKGDVSIEDAKILGFRGDNIKDKNINVKKDIIGLNTELRGVNPSRMIKELRREFSSVKGKATIGPLKEEISGKKKGILVKYKDGSTLSFRPQGESGHPKIEIKDTHKGIAEKITFKD